MSDARPSAWAREDGSDPGGTRVYRTSPWLRGLLAVAFFALAAGAVAVGFFGALPERGTSLVLALLAGSSWYGWALARRRRVSIDDGGLTVVEWKKPLRLERAELRGYRRSYSNS